MSKIGINTSTKLVQQQKLVLTQELQLFLKMIQMTTLELKDYLEEQLVENPTLEEDQTKESDEDSNDEDEFDLSSFESLASSNNDDYPHSRDVFSEVEDENPWENRVEKLQSLYEYLQWQLGVSDFNETEYDIANLIIGNINEDGYLETSINEIVNNLSNGKPQDSEKLLEIGKQVLFKIQTTFDPVGIGSSNLVECLKIQAFELGYQEKDPVIKVIESHLEDISKENYEIIKDTFEINQDDLEEILEIIKNLEPKPGRPFYIKDTEKYIVPDFYLYKVGNSYQLQFNKNFPRVRISNYYRNLIRNQKSLATETKKYLREKLEAARRILKCLEEREIAVRKVVEKITEVQRDYFEHGEEYIKPLRLKDIAESVGVHESTVSRITSNRYMQTPAGVIELKSLFSRGVDTSSGKQVSLNKVKSMIKEIISNESPVNPFSDEDISKILERRNVKVARRTVAKYRKILKIPSSSKRMQKGDSLQ